MALIKCKECGSMISDRAIKCPKCGCPNDGLDVTKAQGNERFVPSGVPAEPANLKPTASSLIIKMISV